MTETLRMGRLLIEVQEATQFLLQKVGGNEWHINDCLRGETNATVLMAHLVKDEIRI